MRSLLLTPVALAALAMGVACSPQAATQPQAPQGGTTAPAATAPAKPTPAPLTRVRIGVPPGDETPELQAAANTINLIVDRSLGLPTETFKVSDYTAVIEALRTGRIDIAFGSPFMVPIAQQVAGAQIVVGFKAPTYNSVILARTDRGINSLADLRGKQIALVDPASTSGNIVPRTVLARGGIIPERDMRYVYAGGHDSAALALANGSVDAAGVAGAVYGIMVDRGILNPQQVKVLAESEPIPVGLVILARRDLDPAVLDRIRAYAMQSPLPQELVDSFRVLRLESAFMPSNEDFQIFRDSIEKAGVDINKIR